MPQDLLSRLLAGYPDIIYYLFYGSLVALVLILAQLAWRGETWGTLKGLTGSRLRLMHASPENREEPNEEVQRRSASFAVALLIAFFWVRILELV